MAIDKYDLLLKSQELRKRLGESNESPMDIFSLASDIDKLTIVRYPMGDNLSGMCVKTENGGLVAINSKMTLGRQRFSLAHELYHLFYDTNMTAICLTKIDVDNDLEKSADTFASYLLISPSSLKPKIAALKQNTNRSIMLNDVIRLEQYYLVSRQAMLNRLISDREISWEQAETMKTDVIHSAMALGYSRELYKPLPRNKQYQTYGHLIKQVNEALDKDLISNGKYEEILLQAFRQDLVYGDEDEGGEVFD